MKLIVIAVDFSPASANALLYGVQIAKGLNVKVILFHAYTLPSSIPAIGIGISNIGVMFEIKQQLDDFAKLILKGNAPEVETVCEVGNPQEAIINIAKEKEADLIITGMKGSGKNIKKVFGSTASLLTAGANVPVLIIPEEAVFQSPDVIGFASDGNINSLREDLYKFKEIKEAFHSKLFVVNVVKNEDVEHLKVSENLDEENFSDIAFEFPVDADIRQGLDAFIKQEDVKLLVMMPHNHDWAERLFRKSETKEMIFHTHIPLMILPHTYRR